MGSVSCRGASQGCSNKVDPTSCDVLSAANLSNSGHHQTGKRTIQYTALFVRMSVCLLDVTVPVCGLFVSSAEPWDQSRCCLYISDDVPDLAH